MNLLTRFLRRPFVVCRVIAPLAALLLPDTAIAQIGITRAEAEARFGLIPLLDNGKPANPVEGFDCYETKSTGAGIRYFWLFEKDRLVGITGHDERSKTWLDDFPVAMDTFCSHVLDGKPKQSRWEWVSDLASPFPPLGASWEQLVPRMKTLHYQRTITYDRATGRVLNESPWMPAKWFTGRYDLNRAWEYHAFAAYASADRKIYAAATFDESHDDKRQFATDQGPKCSGFLIGSSEVFWKHLCRATTDKPLDLIRAYEFRLDEFLAKHWEQEFSASRKPANLQPNLPQADGYDEFASKKRAEVLRLRTLGVLRAAIDLGHWESEKLASELKSIDDKERSVAAAFCGLLTLDIRKLDGDRTERRCAVLAELAGVKDLAALQPIAAGTNSTKPAARAACRRIAERLKLDGCPVDRATDAQWKAWLTMVVGPAEPQPK